MEAFFVLLGACILLAGPVAFFVALSALRTAGRLERQVQDLKREITASAAALDRKLASLERHLTPLPGEPRRETVEAATAPVAPPAAAPFVAASPPPAPPVSPAPPAAPAPPVRAAAAPRPPPPVSPPPAPAEAKHAPAPAAIPRGTESWEAVIGGSWLNRIGVASLVIAIAFGLGYSLTVLGPSGKALLATAVSLFLLGAGVVLERRERYRLYGRGLIAGGWAALYATAYAIHELEATRIVEDPRAGFAVLLAVGAGMILHSLRYANQGLTSLAYALAYAAIVLHSISAYTLVAATILGFGTILHLLRRRWYEVAFGGIAATYGSLLLWYLRQEALTMETLRLGIAALAIDWILFIAADFASEPRDAEERKNATVVGAINAAAAGFLAWLAWSRVVPLESWKPLAALGVAYVITTILLRRFGRETLHPVHSLAAALLLAFAAWKGLSLQNATWFWLAEAQVLAVAGVLLKDRFHRMMGSILFLAPALAIVYEQGRARVERGEGAFDLPQFLLTVAACACFYLTFARLKESAAADAAGRVEEAIRRTLPYVAFALIVVALWVQLPEVWVAPAAAVLMILLFELSAARDLPDFRVQSYLASIVALSAAVALSAGSQAAFGGIASRIPALLIVSAAFFTFFLRRREGRARLLTEEDSVRPAFSWAGAGLIAIVVWLESRPAAVGPLWILLALLLVEAGIALNELHLKHPGYATVIAAGMSLAMSNLTATDRVSGISVRAATLLPSIAAAYYLWWRLRSIGHDPEVRAARPADEVVGRILSYLAAGMLGLFVRFEFGLENAALRWSLAMVVLFALGYLLRDADFRMQAYFLAAGVFARAVGADFTQAVPVFGISGPFAVAVVSVACLVVAGFVVSAHAPEPGAAPRADRRSLRIESRLERIGRDLVWLLAVAMAAIYSFRTQSGFMLIVTWAIEGLVATAAGFALRARSLRLAGLGLLGVALAMTLYRTITEFDTVGRIVSFAVLGVVLLIVSFVYTRYRDMFRRLP